ncbi:hypothetical protein [Psychromonas antarctica]|uniref:hypothetical protein n=1 Tax=Psychromonas antarctica TaxID=67573 RepID=UPI001EE81D32|nr:hypothetical protein [Psychromonas antarctica]MCG6202746.1 hypothetical protein [Psychromonas antarctica]
MHKLINEISSATFLLTLFTGLLYISGDAYIYGYLDELSLVQKLFMPSFNETLSQGFIMLFIGGIYLVIPSFFIAILFYSYMFMIGEISEVAFIRKIWNFIFPSSKREREYKKPELITRILNLALTFLVFTMFIALFLFTIFKVIDFASVQGKEQAQKDLIKFKSFNEYNEIIIAEKNVKGAVLRCSSTHCAVYIKEKNIIKTVPVSSIKSISIEQAKHNKSLNTEA